MGPIVWDQFGVGLGSIWDQFGVELGLVRGRGGVGLADSQVLQSFVDTSYTSLCVPSFKTRIDPFSSNIE